MQFDVHMIHFAVILPVYNVEPYIRDCLDSLMRQTAHNIDFILVDDGSPDRCGEICDEYARKDSRFHVIHQVNAGVGAARNAGLNAIGSLLSVEQQKNCYVSFCDPDDFILSDTAYEDLEKLLNEHSSDILMFDCCTSNEDLTLQHRRSIGQRQPVEKFSEEQIGGSLFPAMVLGRTFKGFSIMGVIVVTLFKYSLLDDGQRFRTDIRKAEDQLFIAHLLPKVRSAVLCDKLLYNYRIRSGSAITTYKAPLKEGLDKGLSIISDLKKAADKMSGLSVQFKQLYFGRRYIDVAMNIAVGLTDSRNTMTFKEKRCRAKELLRSENLQRAVNENSPSDISVTYRLLRWTLMSAPVSVALCCGKVINMLKSGRKKLHRK